jgi:hypothetical protein
MNNAYIFIIASSGLVYLAEEELSLRSGNFISKIIH